MSSDPNDQQPAANQHGPTRFQHEDSVPSLNQPTAGAGPEIYTAEIAANPHDSATPSPSLSTLSDAPNLQSTPVMSYLHWSSLFFDMVAHGRQYILPIAFAFISATRQNWFWGIAAIVSLVFTLLRTFFRYFTLHFGIQKGELIVNQGLIFKSTRTIPTRKIQNIDLRQNLLHRLFGVYEVHVETASGQDAEAVLRVLTKSQIDQLRAEIFSTAQVASADSVPHPAADFYNTDVASPSTTIQDFNATTTAPLGHQTTDSTQRRNPATEHPETVLLQVPISHLLFAGLTSNRGWVVVGVVIGLYYQFVSWESWDNKVIGKWIRQLLPLMPHDQNGWLGLAGIALLFWACLKLFGMGWYVVRFFGYRLALSGDDLRVTCGLLTSYSVTVPRERIQFISLQQPWLFRWRGYTRISIETAGSASQSDGQDQIQLMRTSFVPIIALSEVGPLLSAIRPGLHWDESLWTWQGTANGTRNRLLRFNLIVGCLISGLVSALYRPWGLLVPPVLIPLLIWYAHKTAKSLRYARTPFGVVYRSGLWTRKTSMTFFEKLQTMNITQSPFDRRWGMIELHFDTAGAGPADHPIHVRYLDQHWAQHEFSELRDLASRHSPRRKKVDLTPTIQFN